MTGKPLLTQGRIGVLMGGQSSEREVSLRTGAGCASGTLPARI